MSLHSKIDNKKRDAIFVQLLKEVGLPEPKPELRFSKDRMWRFDFAYPEAKLAIEIEGGVWNNGRHVTGTGFEDDCEKYNTAVLMGWYVLRIPTKILFKKITFELIKQCYFKFLKPDQLPDNKLFN